jgi:diaminohydroxyphosphoribosylaminopyrimidine deaminase / 5-amino-6-(5-phosphoribosylamino)uracil reductase
MEQGVDDKYMRRCLELASGAEGMTYPNPMVGSVIVHEGRIIGEGYHLKSGEPHAEVIAINSVSDNLKLQNSTLYVNLEPCSHFWKTPPCADLIIKSKIPRVVIGTTDSSDKVSGRGVQKLRDAGIEVINGVIEDECRWLNRRFFMFSEEGRPWIILKWAESADGYIDGLRTAVHDAKPTWISGKPERVLVHKWRASEQAILVGAGTIRADNPKLNVREWEGNDPVRIILSGSGKFDEHIAINETNGTLIVFTGSMNTTLEKAIKVELDYNYSVPLQIVEYLQKAGIQSLFIEGGASVLNQFISAGLWDEARLFKGKRYFNDGVKAPEINGMFLSETIFEGSSLYVYTNRGVRDSHMVDNLNKNL